MVPPRVIYTFDSKFSIKVAGVKLCDHQAVWGAIQKVAAQQQFYRIFSKIKQLDCAPISCQNLSKAQLCPLDSRQRRVIRRASQEQEMSTNVGHPGVAKLSVNALQNFSSPGLKKVI